MNWLHSCKQVAALLSQRMDGPLGPVDRLRLSAHLSMCSDCDAVDTQLKGLRTMTSELFGTSLGDEAAQPGYTQEHAHKQAQRQAPGALTAEEIGKIDRHVSHGQHDQLVDGAAVAAPPGGLPAPVTDTKEAP